MGVGLTEPSSESAGLLKFVSNTELEKIEDKVAAEAEQFSEPINALAGFVHKRWESARSAKLEIEDDLLNNLRQRKGQYKPEVLAEINKSGGSTVFMMLTNVKCRAAESWINEILLSDKKPWEAKATPIPELPPYIEEEIRKQIDLEAYEAGRMGVVVTQEQVDEAFGEVREKFMKRLKKQAQKTAARMSRTIEDNFTEGGWEPAMKEVVKDIVTFKTGILRGPVIRKDRSLSWKRANGDYKPKLTDKLKKFYYRVSPFDLYPGPNTRGVNDGYLFERHRMRRSDLVALKGVPGYSTDAINLVLEAYGSGGLRDWLFNDQIRADLEGRPNEYIRGGYDEIIDAVEYNGTASGEMLLEWGVDEKLVSSPYAEYEVNVWLIGIYVIRAVLNKDPLKRRNYHACSFEETPGAFWGQGVPDLMSDVQDVCNAAARSLVNNMAIASGPQVEIFTDRLPPGEDITEIHPWKIWQTTSDPNASGTGRAMQFFSPDSHAEQLMRVYDHFSKLADEYTGIPAYAYGSSDVGGAGRTASGLSMLMTSAARGIKSVIGNIDRIIEGTVVLTFDHLMMYSKDKSIKGDTQVRASGSRSLMTREQQAIRRNEFLATTNNEIDFQIMGPKGRAALLRESAKSLEIPADDVIPDETELNAQMQLAMQQQMNGQLPESQNTDMAGNKAGGMNLMQPNAG